MKWHHFALSILLAGVAKSSASSRTSASEPAAIPSIDPRIVPQVVSPKRATGPVVHNAAGGGVAAVLPGPQFIAALNPKFREPVGQVMKAPTLSIATQEDDFFAQASLYDWLLDHPDRASLAWRRMGVPCVEIQLIEGGRFLWKDEQGSELVWQPVGRFSDGIVWYATGKVKAAALIPPTGVKAVAILHCPREVLKSGSETATFSPKLSVFVQMDSVAASAALRILGPTAPRLAEQGAEQILLFFSGPARRLFAYPEQTDELLAPPTRKR